MKATSPRRVAAAGSLSTRRCRWMDRAAPRPGSGLPGCRPHRVGAESELVTCVHGSGAGVPRRPSHPGGSRWSGHRICSVSSPSRCRVWQVAAVRGLLRGHGRCGAVAADAVDRVGLPPSVRRALVVGVVGALRRPDAVLVELDGGRRATTSPRLTAVEARQVAEAVGGRVRPLAAGPDSIVHWLLEPWPLVEVITQEGGDLQFVRMVGED